MIHPLLDSPLHAHLHQPVHIVGRCLIIRRAGYQRVDFFLRIALLGVVPVYTHPFQELAVINNVLLKTVAHFVHIVHMHISIIGIHLAAALIDGHKHRFDARGSLCHQRGGTRRCNGQTGYVATAILPHVLIQLWVGLFQTAHKGIGLLAPSIVYLKGATLLGHRHR